MHRITGTGQTLAFSGMCVALAASPYDFPTYAQAIADLDLAPQVAYGIKWALAFPFAYHSLNGFRHLVRVYTCLDHYYLCTIACVILFICISL